MNDDALREAVRLMCAAGVRFVGGEFRERFIDPGEVVAYVRDPVAWTAKREGVSVTDMIVCINFANSGAHEPIRCEAKTKKGRRCKNPVAGISHGICYEPQAYAEAKARGGYCKLHNGEG